MRFVFADVFKYFYFACVLVLDVCHVVTGAEGAIRGNGLGQGHTLKKRKDLDPQTCVENFDIHRDKIIRTEESREMGAKYLNEIDLASREECLRLCCETEECDVFVYEEKEQGSCYLFRCGPPDDFKCKFTRHTNFTSAVLAISRRLAELEDQIRLRKHEQDLASLSKRVRERQEQMLARAPLAEALSVGAVKTSAPSTTTVAPTAVGHKETTVSTPAARRCSPYQFECHNSGECIAIYNACDGVAQCSDGSDEAAELDCPDAVAAAAVASERPSPAAAPRRPVPRPAQPAPPAAPKELMPPPQIYDSSDEPIIQKGPPANRPPFMHPMHQEPIQWPNQLSQMQASVQNMKMKPYEDERRSHIFNHKGGLQVTEAESAAPSIYEYKGPYDSIPESTWQHKQWPQPNQDQLMSNDGRPMYHMEQESLNSWKQQSMSSSESDQRPIESMMPRIRPLSQQAMEKYDDRSGDNYMVNKNKMWSIPQSPIKSSVHQRYPEVMSNSPHSYSIQSDRAPHQEKHAYKQNLSKPPVIATAEEDTQMTDPEKADDSESSTQTKQKSVKSKLKETQTKEEKPQEKTRKHKKKEDYEVETEDEVIKETSIVVTRKKLIDDEDDHDGLSTSPPGAIIILIIGLIMTSTMMVMICWRAKVSRRRRRGTKGGFAHDADYLVNGMYL